MNTKLQLWFAWSLIPFMIIYTFGFSYVAGGLPPQAPSETAKQIAAWYAQNATFIETGQAIALFATTIMFAWPISISVQMARIEGAFPIMAIAQYVTAIILSLLTMLCHFFFIFAAFRPDANPDTVRMLSDAGRLGYVLGYPEYVIQLLLIGIVGLMDKRPQRFLPPWACYATIFTGFSSIIGAAGGCFKGGPLAWNGLALWVPVATFTVWVLFIMEPYLIVAIKRQALEESVRRSDAQSRTQSGFRPVSSR